MNLPMKMTIEKENIVYLSECFDILMNINKHII